MSKCKRPNMAKSAVMQVQFRPRQEPDRKKYNRKKDANKAHKLGLDAFWGIGFPACSGGCV